MTQLDNTGLNFFISQKSVDFILSRSSIRSAHQLCRVCAGKWFPSVGSPRSGSEQSLLFLHTWRRRCTNTIVHWTHCSIYELSPSLISLHIVRCSRDRRQTEYFWTSNAAPWVHRGLHTSQTYWTADYNFRPPSAAFSPFLIWKWQSLDRCCTDNRRFPAFQWEYSLLPIGLYRHQSNTNNF